MIRVALAGIFSIALFQCDDGGSEPKPTFNLPTIEVDQTSISTEQGQTITLALNVEAEAGLSSVTQGTEVIQNYDGTTTSDQITYNYLAQDIGEITLTFVVQDALSETAEISVVLTISEGVDLGFVVLDFAGAATGTNSWERESWDVRTIFDFDVTGSFVNSATAQVVNTQAQLYFGQDNPSTDDNAKVLKIEKTPPEGFDNWGGWAHVIFNLGQTMDQTMIDELPQWDVDNGQQTTGTKVFQVDAYYDDTVDPDFSWSDLTALTDIFNADPSKGYKIELTLGSYDAIGFGGHDGDGYYIEYEAYIPEPNKWEVLTFGVVGTGRTDNYFPTKETSVASDMVDCVKFLPAGGYSAGDANPVYFKNLRIVDVQ